MARHQRVRPRHGKAELILEAGLAAVRQGREPQLDAMENFGTLEVFDPHEQVQRTKLINLRNDPIGRLHKNRQLGDKEIAAVRLKAARLWERDFEIAEIGRIKAMDPTKVVIDGGGNFTAAETDQRLRALAQLGRVREALGLLRIPTAFGNEVRILGARLLVWVLGKKFDLADVAELLGYDRRQLPLLGHLIDCLDVTAIGYGLSLDPKRQNAHQR